MIESTLRGNMSRPLKATETAIFTREDARRQYLITLASEAPSILQELASIVSIPTEQGERLTQTDPRLPFRSFLEITPYNLASIVKETLAGKSPNVSYLCSRDKSVFEWLAKWRLADQWIIEWVEQTAREWIEGRGMGGWAPRVYRMETAQNPFDFRIDSGWRPERETWEAWQSEAARRFRGEMSKYRKDVLTKAVSPPLRPIPKHHYEWTVRHQNLGRPYALVARAGPGKPAHEKTVRAAVRRVAEAIGLTLRPISAGRPVNSGRFTE